MVALKAASAVAPWMARFRLGGAKLSSWPSKEVEVEGLEVPTQDMNENVCGFFPASLRELKGQCFARDSGMPE